MRFPYMETRNWASSKKSSGYLYPNVFKKETHNILTFSTNILSLLWNVF